MSRRHNTAALLPITLILGTMAALLGLRLPRLAGPARGAARAGRGRAPRVGRGVPATARPGRGTFVTPFTCKGLPGPIAPVEGRATIRLPNQGRLASSQGLTLHLGTRLILLAMRIGEVASRAGVNRQTLRFYEREGLLPGPTRRANGYREYPPRTVALVQFIKRAQELGFSLDEAKALSELQQTADRDRPRVRALAEAKLADVRQRIAQLHAIEQALAALVGSCCREDTPHCAILNALTDPSVQPLSPR